MTVRMIGVKMKTGKILNHWVVNKDKNFAVLNTTLTIFAHCLHLYNYLQNVQHTGMYMYRCMCSYNVNSSDVNWFSIVYPNLSEIH